MTKPEKIKQFAPELRAEIQFGLENSVDYSSVDDVIEQARDFLERNQVWQGAEEYIVDLRNGYWNEENKVEKQINEKLQESAIQELKFQYALWKKDYKTAYEHACSTLLYVPVDRFSVSVDSYHFGNLINYQNWNPRQNVLDIAKRYMNP